MFSLPWVEKYRPLIMEHVFSQQNTVEAVSKLLERKAIPHLIFYGPPGTGKTTIASICANMIFRSQDDRRMNVLELNASDERGIDVVRYQIKRFVGTKTVSGEDGVKLVILDEADSMTNSAQDALRRIMEKNSRGSRFFLLCNDIGSITSAIKSRCMLFRFSPIQKKDMTIRIQEVIDKERICISKDGIEAIVEMSNGDMRKALNTLQAVSSYSAAIDSSVAYRCEAYPSPKVLRQILNLLFNSSLDSSYLEIRAIINEYSYSIRDIFDGIFKILVLVELSSEASVYLYQKLADLEVLMSLEGGDLIWLGCLVGIFQVTRKIMKDRHQISF